MSFSYPSLCIIYADANFLNFIPAQAHYQEQLDAVDTSWRDADKNGDGALSLPEYNDFVQVAHWLEHQENLASKVLGDEKHLFDGWREEL